ncbi:hypothetical protein [Amycolatopsis alkalitolerans]|uniref:Uncharacterized protein n=1 Tax=Amycolatopsis alkalitolerans TaxID=2547244 RepID=A0A5C4M7D0_9PSEU|nr:hypothetical protein [Amycolatopsis alkalitolerans]TNC26953.1 hypothetical protein FG385_11005 [Amycolatopsis alkalitolerans]
MAWDTTLGVAAIMGLYGLAILIVLWPGPKHGRRLLQRWGVTSPSEMDIDESVRYLKRRRFWYPWLFFVIPLTGLGHESGIWAIGGTMLLGALLGELLAWRPPVHARREAMLSRRVLTDLVPAWALILLAASLAGGMVRTIIEREWPQLGVTIGCTVVVGVVLVLALRRPAAGDAAVDLVLRARSARVAAGLAIVLPGIGEHVTSFPSMLLLVVSLAAGIAVAAPDRRSASALV